MKIQSDDGGGTQVAFDPTDLETAVRMLGDKWKYQILNALLKLGPLRFSHFQWYIPAISPTVLTEQLKALEAAAIIFRRQDENSKAAKEYTLTNAACARGR